MAVNISRSITQRKFVTIEVTKAEVAEFYLFPKKNRLAVVLEFKDAQDKLVDREVWLLYGQPYSDIMTGAPVGQTTLAALRRGLEQVINSAENTPGKKDEMIRGGQLAVYKTVKMSFE